VSDIDTAVVDSLKVIDLKWPIREADIGREQYINAAKHRPRRPKGNQCHAGYP